MKVVLVVSRIKGLPLDDTISRLVCISKYGEQDISRLMQSLVTWKFGLGIVSESWYQYDIKFGFEYTANIVYINSLVQSAGGVPTWAAPAGGGKVLQVVSAVYSTSTGITTTAYADTGLTATITPTSATSKILVLISQSITLSGGQVSGGAVKVLRGATDIYTVAGTNNQAFLAGETGANSYLGGSFAFNYLDSPATTSATTYKTQGRRNASASSVMTFNADGASSSITLLEIGA